MKKRLMVIGIMFCAVVQLEIQLSADSRSSRGFLSTAEREEREHMSEISDSTLTEHVLV